MPIANQDSRQEAMLLMLDLPSGHLYRTGRPMMESFLAILAAHHRPMDFEASDADDARSTVSHASSKQTFKFWIKDLEKISLFTRFSIFYVDAVETFTKAVGSHSIPADSKIAHGFPTGDDRKGSRSRLTRPSAGFGFKDFISLVTAPKMKIRKLTVVSK